MAPIREGLVPMWVLGDVDIRLGQEPRQAPSLRTEMDGRVPQESFRGLRSVWLMARVGSAPYKKSSSFPRKPGQKPRAMGSKGKARSAI